MRARGPWPAWAIAAAWAAIATPVARADVSIPDTLRFLPIPADTAVAERGPGPETMGDPPAQWLRAPFGDNLLMDPRRFRSMYGQGTHTDLLLDYNRVDGLRLGLNTQYQSRTRYAPRVAGRLEYATGRGRTLYGAQVEQPLTRNGRYAAGVSWVRRTDHYDLQQHEDLENTLALLFGRQDYRDYFERVGGPEAVREVIQAFVAEMADDFVIGFLFQGRDLQRVVTHEVEHATRLLGGPSAYTGRPLAAVHGPLRINRGHFRRRLALLRSLLRRRGVEEEVISRWIDHDLRLEPVITDGLDCVPEVGP